MESSSSSTTPAPARAPAPAAGAAARTLLSRWILQQYRDGAMDEDTATAAIDLLVQAPAQAPPPEATVAPPPPTPQAQAPPTEATVAPPPPTPQAQAPPTEAAVTPTPTPQAQAPPAEAAVETPTSQVQTSETSAAADFLTVLMDVVNDQASDNIIAWSDDGVSFVIKDRDEFMVKIMPKFMEFTKVSKFKPFGAYMRSWGFHGSKSNLRSGWFQHKDQLFCKDHPEHLAQIEKVAREPPKKRQKVVDNSMFEIESVVGRRMKMDHQQLQGGEATPQSHEFLVRWKGCGQEEDSWVCFEDMTESAQQEVLNRYKWGQDDTDDTGAGQAVLPNPNASRRYPDAIDL